MESVTEGGFTEPQARALSRALSRLIENHLVTRDYLDLRLAQLKFDIVQWMVATIVVQTGAIAVLLKMLH